jgi:hypothetical protein
VQSCLCELGGLLNPQLAMAVIEMGVVQLILIMLTAAVRSWVDRASRGKRCCSWQRWRGLACSQTTLRRLRCWTRARGIAKWRWRPASSRSSSVGLPPCAARSAPGAGFTHARPRMPQPARCLHHIARPSLGPGKSGPDQLLHDRVCMQKLSVSSSMTRECCNIAVRHIAHVVRGIRCPAQASCWSRTTSRLL